MVETVGCGLCGCDYAQVVLRQQDLLHRVSTEEFSIVRCSGCGLMYLNPRPTRLEIGRYYPEQYFSPPPIRIRTEFERSVKRFSSKVKRWIMEDFYGYPTRKSTGLWRHLRRILLWPEKLRRIFRGREVVPWIGEGHLLDIGCGPGGNLATFQEQGWEVYGIEMSDVAVRQARERVGNRIHSGTLETAPFEGESFDVILLSHTLEHLFNPADALAHVRRLLKPEGLLVITVPNIMSLEARLFGRWWVPWDVPRHLYHFEKTTLVRLLEQVGFRVTRSRTGVGTLFFLASLERVWTHKFSGSRSARLVWTTIDRLVARPFCLVAGHLGYGTEITVHAVKARAAEAHRESDRSAAASRVLCG